MLRRWFLRPIERRAEFLEPASNASFSGKYAVLLEQEGYTILSGKHRIPIRITVDGEDLESRYFFDYIVKKDEEMFAVRCARSRKAIQWSGSGVRDEFMPYFLLYDEISGVLYVDAEQQQIKKIQFQYE